MKFPYDLSEQRLSLLSKEDRELYMYEHSPYYSYTAKEKAFKELVEARQIRNQYYINEFLNDDSLKDLESNDMQELAEALVDEELNEYKEMIINLFEKDYEIITGKDSREMLEKIVDDLFLQSKTLNEAPGPDQTYWMKGLEGAFLGLLGTGIGAIAGLFMAGKDKAAQKALERSMNLAVEMIDTGVNKKKSFFAKLKDKFLGTKSYDNAGDQSVACFRSIQEMFERIWLSNMLVNAKVLGFIGENVLDDVTNQHFTGGLYSNKKGSFYKEVDDKFRSYFKN